MSVKGIGLCRERCKLKTVIRQPNFAEINNWNYFWHGRSTWNPYECRRVPRLFQKNTWFWARY